VSKCGTLRPDAASEHDYYTMILGFTGTQKGMTENQKKIFRQFILNHRPKNLCHGDCVGADVEAHLIVKDCFPKCHIEIFPPINNSKRAFTTRHSTPTIILHPEMDYIARNHAIVDNCDTLIATPKGKEQLRSGTWATIRYALKCQKNIYIIFPDGTLGGILGKWKTEGSTLVNLLKETK